MVTLFFAIPASIAGPSNLLNVEGFMVVSCHLWSLGGLCLYCMQLAKD
ncbi:hypothetical protein [Kosmotoga pacifica]|nr:hypothetical protein [Kosmotoga pacifica]